MPSDEFSSSSSGVMLASTASSPKRRRVSLEREGGDAPTKNMFAKGVTDVSPQLHLPTSEEIATTGKSHVAGTSTGKEMLTIVVKLLGGGESSLTIKNVATDTTILDLKNRIYEETKRMDYPDQYEEEKAASDSPKTVPVERQRLIYRGRMLTRGADILGKDVGMKGCPGEGSTCVVHLAPIPEGKSLTKRKAEENKSAASTTESSQGRLAGNLSGTNVENFLRNATARINSPSGTLLASYETRPGPVVARSMTLPTIFGLAPHQTSTQHFTQLSAANGPMPMGASSLAYGGPSRALPSPASILGLPLVSFAAQTDAHRSPRLWEQSASIANFGFHHGGFPVPATNVTHPGSSLNNSTSVFRSLLADELFGRTITPPVSSERGWGHHPAYGRVLDSPSADNRVAGPHPSQVDNTVMFDRFDPHGSFQRQDAMARLDDPERALRFSSPNQLEVVMRSCRQLEAINNSLNPGLTDVIGGLRPSEGAAAWRSTEEGETRAQIERVAELLDRTAHQSARLAQLLRAHRNTS